ncbi:hypothetical protein D9M68_809230 [compost metagenome]
MLNDIAEWRGTSNLAEVVEQLIRETHMLGQERSAHWVRIPRHEFHVSENVAHYLMAEGIRLSNRELLQELKEEWRD